MKNHKKYSVIIPTLNEEAHIGRCINNVRKCLPTSEIIVVDGGSSDGTTEIIKDEKVKLFSTEKGRGYQLNLGAENSNGEILIFLHADTILPKNCKKIINDFFKNEKVNVATFILSFDVENKLLKFYSNFTKKDSIFTRFGDCGIVVRKKYFVNNNFPNWPIFEDVHFLRLARKKDKIYTIPAKVITSSRRFLKNGIIRTQLRNSYYLFLYFIGISKKSLRNKYNKIKNFNNNATIVFTRYPVEGKVKTRLAKTLGNKFTLNFYKICAEHTFKEILKINSKENINYLFYSNKEDKKNIAKWVNNKFLLFHQNGNDLGERMFNAFNKVFGNGASKAVIIGTDLPDISEEIITKAFSNLDYNDVVIGPATDGGYYLLGLTKNYFELFDNIDWSTDAVFSKTLEIINNKNLKYSLLPELSDIDTEQDIRNWLNKETILKPNNIKSFVQSELITN